MGRADKLRLGDHNAICDRCGLKFKASELKKTWDNLYVCTTNKCYEERHPMDFFRGKKDDQSVDYTRPDDAGAAGLDINGDTTQPTPVYTPDPPPSGTFDGGL